MSILPLIKADLDRVCRDGRWQVASQLMAQRLSQRLKAHRPSLVTWYGGTQGLAGELYLLVTLLHVPFYLWLCGFRFGFDMAVSNRIRLPIVSMVDDI